MSEMQLFPKDDLPPRQQVTTKFPVVGEKEPDPRAIDLKTWSLSVGGLVERPVSLSWDEFMNLPQVNVVHDIHCVTRWSKLGTQLEGVPFETIAKLVQPEPEAKFVQFVAYSDRDHDTSLPLDVCMNEGVLFVHSIDGEPLTVEHGFPLRTFAPTKYFYKGLKWVKEVRFLSEDVIGFWERGGYHNEADPFQEQRYVSGNLLPNAVQKLRETGDFSRYKDEVLISLDLSGIDLSDRDLRGIQLKNCNLSGVNFSGSNLDGANFTNSDLRHAILRGVSLNGADLDGVLLMGADLSYASARDSYLNATEFKRADEPDAVVTGLDLSRAQIEGLLEDQVKFLREQGVITYEE